VRFWRTRSPDDLTPELVVGGLVSYAGVTFITLKDYRYSLSALVFVAALAVAWVPALSGRWLRLAAGALVAVALVNLIGVSTNTGPTLTVSLAGDRAPTPMGERTVRIYNPSGFIANKPRDDGALLEVMRGLFAEGHRKLHFEAGDLYFSDTGVSVVQTIAGLEYPATWDPAAVPPDVLFLARRPLEPDSPEPCAVIEDGYGIFVADQRDVTAPFDSYDFICPDSVRSARR
jgi:hypothetical protein